MTATTIDKRISVGNIITIVTVLVALAVGYQSTVSNVEANERNIGDNRRIIESVDARLTALIEGMQSERVLQTRVLTEMQVDIRYLRQGMDKLQDGDPSRK